MAGGPNDSLLAYFNIGTAKYVAFVLGVALVSMHGVRYMLEDHNTCSILLDDGYHLTYSDWQPRGCMMHNYSKRDGEYCMNDKHIMLIGDSRVRQLFFEFARMLSDQQIVEGKEHESLSFRDKSSGIHLDFIWMPDVNLSTVEVYEKLAKDTEPPHFVIHGAASWAIKYRNATVQAFEEYKKNLTTLAPVMSSLAQSTDVLWMLQQPVEEDKLHIARKMITNEQINMYNDAALEILEPTSVKTWKSAAQVSTISNSTEDGLHVNRPLLQIDVQLILNRYCNVKYRPDDGEIYCCQKKEEMTLIQQLLFVIFVISFFSGAFLKVKRKIMSLRPTANQSDQKESTVVVITENVQNGPVADGENATPVKKETPPPSYDYVEVAWALGKFGLIMIYFHICDRTGFIPREQKHYTHLRFFLPLCYITLLGFFFNSRTSQPQVLNRDQTEEWKGWMQLVILIYHMSGASSVLPIYMHIRILVAMYLFQTGYGHFSFFWNKADYGIIRFCQVQFRLNWLVFMLCLVMNRPYQFYYFVPLVTFWFIVVYLTMALWPKVSAKSVAENTSRYVWMVFKFIGLFGIIVTVALSEVFFYNLFDWWPLKEAFVTSDGKLYEWWFRWQLDRFIIPFGMLFSFMYITLKKYNVIQDGDSEDVCKGCTSNLLTFLGFAMVAVYTIFACLCPSKPDCNQTHSYISVLPVTGFILLRNVPGRVRARYSTFFAWFGKISLELFIGQYHIWLAADTKGTLILIPDYPAVNLTITSFIFVCAAHEIFVTTVQLQSFFVPKELKELFKRLAVFICLMTGLLFYRTGSAFKI
ncbi:N-acetylneuraminate (7)9-O-acetyltransferase-like isoform X2 [Ptychodera flava]|uniref:N-acetylneuraminate (7)9-O-acetyltransferase-like isoform X2 n=1 Tax=Ptychodera flava TaxID=63121 RepID=UPI00396A46A9